MEVGYRYPKPTHPRIPGCRQRHTVEHHARRRARVAEIAASVEGERATVSTGEIRIIDRVSAAEAIKRLDEEDLLFLNRLIVDRLKLLSQVKASNLMIQFSQGDRVGFQSSDGRMQEGVVLRLNKKTVSVATDDGHQWNVAPGLLRLIN